jgi:hypothetical protein
MFTQIKMFLRWFRSIFSHEVPVTDDPAPPQGSEPEPAPVPSPTERRASVAWCANHVGRRFSSKPVLALAHGYFWLRDRGAFNSGAATHVCGPGCKHFFRIYRVMEG